MRGSQTAVKSAILYGCLDRIYLIDLSKTSNRWAIAAIVSRHHGTFKANELMKCCHFEDKYEIE